MRLLVLGGTVFLGRHVVAAALAAGHDVTLLHRGRHGRGLFAGEAEHVLGDRADPDLLARVAARSWDGVVDTCAYVPQAARVAWDALAATDAHLVLVTSCNVYPGWPEQVVPDEDAPVWQEAEPTEYGPQKAACERAAEAALGPDRVLSARAGLIVGPHDAVFRLPWWVRRMAAGGDVPVPGRPDAPLQAVDARDLAAWMVAQAQARSSGPVNATAPAGTQTARHLYEAAAAVTQAGARPVWIPDAVLEAHGAVGWDEVPLWLPERGFPGTYAVGSARAQAMGLICRPLGETIADVWDWLRAGGEEELGEWSAHNRPRGLTPEREAELLAAARAT
jgi:nucleoside-diphosphate-sugar epimerase